MKCLVSAVPMKTLRWLSKKEKMEGKDLETVSLTE